jgi:hypothetical protein
VKRTIILATATGLALAAATSVGTALAHDVPNMEHTHAFKQTGYGTYRQGHSVNGPHGSITIFSPRTYNELQGAPPVEFARPEPITTAPGTPANQTRAVQNPALDYGKKQKDDYGD